MTAYSFRTLLVATICCAGLSDARADTVLQGSYQLAFAGSFQTRGVKVVDEDGEREINAGRIGEPEDIAAEPVPEAAPEAPAASSDEVPTVGFEELLSHPTALLDGKSIKQLAAGEPVFSPIEGLPDAAWQGQSCSSCHQWTQERLCEQGNFYVKQGTGAVTRKQHPYGGDFKQVLRRWADNGCP